MRILRAVRTAAVRLGLSLVSVGLLLGAPAKAAWDKPWEGSDRALVIDAYEFNPINWKELTSDKRIVGFINKASDGLPPEWKCKGKTGDDELICKNRWWKYSVTKELYMTRRAMAKELGLKWGAYHLGRPGNPREQADHFIDFAEPGPDELIALDIEDNTPEWMSLADAEIFANQVFIRTGRYPVLYTNGSTAKWIADYREKYKLLSRLPLWYARYRDDITGKFPEDVWPSYALWQFSSMHNCSTKKCPYRVKGAKSDIDVNVSSLGVEDLRAAWPFPNLVRPLEEAVPVAEAAPAAPSTAVAGLGATAGAMLSSLAGKVAAMAEPSVRHVEKVIAGEVTLPEPVQPASVEPKPAAATLISAYAPSEGRHVAVDPLKLLTETALREKAAAKSAPMGAAQPKPKASIGPNAFSGMHRAMQDVAAIVTMPGVARNPAKQTSAPSFGAIERSRVRGWLEASAARERASALAAVPSPAKPNGRGDRPSAGRADGRIDRAFVATR